MILFSASDFRTMPEKREPSNGLCWDIVAWESLLTALDSKQPKTGMQLTLCDSKPLLT